MPITLPDLEIVDIDHGHHNLEGFDCSDDDLNDFVRNDCTKYHDQLLSWTKIALYQNRAVGFLCLSTDAISLGSEEPWVFRFGKDVPIKHIPALKIGRLASVSDLQRGSGVGKSLVKYAIGVAFRLNEELRTGCRFLTVDAYPRSISFYEHVGFQKSQHKSYKNRENPAMYYDIISGIEF
jgi:GNAT superfamily N-acetyltransferase